MKENESFANQVKREIIENLVNKKSSYYHVIKGLLTFNSNLYSSNKLLNLNELDLIKKIETIIKKNEKIKNGLSIEKNRSYYVLKIDNLNLANKLIKKYQNNELQFKNDTSRQYSSFLCGVFLYCGNSANPLDEYHINFSFDQKKDARLFCEFLKARFINSKCYCTSKINNVYLKDSENIEDLLTFMGATKNALSLMNIKIYKQLRNKANRATNCETANIGKIIDASSREIEDLKLIKQAGVFEKLTPTLQKTAIQRLNHPEMSLDELAAHLGGISRSGLYHRFSKLHSLALKYSKKDN